MNKQKRFYVYIIRDPRPGKRNLPVWVGKGHGRRAEKHAYRSHNLQLRRFFAICHTLKLKPATKKTFCVDEQAAIKAEIRLIAKYGRRDLKTGSLYNLTDGGDGLVNASAKTRARLARISRKQWRDPEFLKLRNSPEFRAMAKAAHDKYWAEPKSREKQSKISAEVMRKLWKDPKFRKRRTAQISKIFRGLWADPKHRAMMRKLWDDPKFHKAAAARGAQAMHKLWADKKFRAKMSARIAITASKQWDDPKFKKKMIQAVRKLWKDPKFREAQSVGMAKRSRKLWKDPKFRKAKSLQSAAHARKQWRDPNHRKTVITAIRKRWRDPVFRKAAAVRSATHARRMRRRWADPKFRAMMKQAHKTKQHA